MIIASVWGLPKAVVDGTEPADVLVISRSWPLKVESRSIAFKSHQVVPGAQTGVIRSPVPREARERPSLTDAEAIRLAEIAIAIEDFYGLPQDIEWVIDPEGIVTILQARPLQQGRVGPKKTSALLPPALGTGKTASPGCAGGQVHVVERDSDLLLFPAGGILVSTNALPKWAMVLDRACGVITEHGSVAGHLATVAREYELPMLVGVKGAGSLFQNGQTITLDANDGEVHEGLLHMASQGSAEETRKMMLGTHVYTILKSVSRHILPLNLLDPSSIDFRPSSCITLHDLTRYIHEKGVQEMFSYGVEHHFQPKSGKQLKTEVPMQWWVLDLEDGFRREVEGPYVSLEDIQSVPMLALWKGITAIPWSGPPAMDRKGFMSVMFEATANPELNEALPSTYAVRNYFLISRTFCSLFSRFGFHFSTVEALAGERIRENYIRFGFKGGAAGLERRSNRVDLLASVLDHIGFQVSADGDSLTARRDHVSQNEVVRSLVSLGHVIMHTRQLDMVMADRGCVERYRNQLMQDIKRLAPGETLESEKDLQLFGA